MKNIKKLLLYFLSAIFIIILYIELSHFWVSCGGTSGHIKNIEIPILIILLSIFYFPTKNIFKNSLFSAIPILGLYILYDIFYHFLERSPRLSDFDNATALSDFSPLLSSGLIIMILLIIAPIVYMIGVYKNETRNKKFYLILTIKFFALFGLLYYLSTSAFSHYLFKNFDDYNWSPASTIKKNGRFTSFIYYDTISRQSKEKLIVFKNKDLDINKQLFANLEIKNKKNIYIIILESFIDPRLIKDSTFNRSPLSQNMKKYLGGGEFSYIKSSIYGGGTAQSEFEILTGIPALSKVSSIEFNILQGNQISGFINVLNKNGYMTSACIATNSNYFNSKNAYKSIGFNKAVFLEESDDFTTRNGDKKIFDGDFFNYCFQNQIRQPKIPYLHYTLGMYGHFPYDRNLELRPDIISTTHKDERIHRVANQFYYRTKALANYIDNILSVDPSSIIFITSDHLPPLLNNGIKYIKEKKENISLLLIDGKRIDINGLYYYDIPRLILKLLNNNKNLKKIDAETYEQIYFKALSESLL